MIENIDKLLQAKTLLSLREPFFATILFRFPLQATDIVPLAAVTPRGTILYNPKAIEKLSVDQIVFLLCHEVMHVALSHSLRRGKRDHIIFNIACDAVINETLIELGIGEFIKGGVRYIGAQSRTAEDIYDEICRKSPTAKGFLDIVFAGDRNLCNSIPGKSQKGSLAINHSELKGIGNAPLQKAADRNLPNGIAVKSPKNNIKGINDSGLKGIRNDPLAEAREIYGEEIEDSELRDIENDVKLALAEAIAKQKMMDSERKNGIGRGMGRFLAILEDYLLAEKLPWHELLARFMTEFVAQNQTWRRPNKRFSDVYLPSVGKEARMGSMIVGIDTSGSISQKMLCCFGRHLFDIIEDCKPEEVIVIWCDYKIQKIETHQYEDVPFKLEAPGRGGTNMREITHWVNKNAPDSDACVILTDGLTPYPSKGEEEVPTLWVITDKTAKKPDYINSVLFEMDD